MLKASPLSHHNPSCAAAAANQSLLSLRHFVEAMGRSSTGSSSSGCGGMPTEQPSPSEVTRRYPMESLSLQWDNSSEIRDRLRSGHHLLRHWDNKRKMATDSYVEKTVENLRLNHFVLQPMFEIVGRNDRALPILDNLMEQISKLFERSKCTYRLHGDRVYQEAWAIRRLCSLAKQQIFRRKPPQDKCYIYII